VRERARKGTNRKEGRKGGKKRNGGGTLRQAGRISRKKGKKDIKEGRTIERKDDGGKKEQRKEGTKEGKKGGREEGTYHPASRADRQLGVNGQGCPDDTELVCGHRGPPSRNHLSRNKFSKKYSAQEERVQARNIQSGKNEFK
jgi:hypothetical protein